MPAGRPPVPTALKIMRGNPGKRALPDNEPEPLVAEPQQPGDLTEGAIVEWENLAPLLLSMRVLTVADRGALGMLCNDLAELKEIQASIRRIGPVVKNEVSGAVKVNPLYSRESELHRRVTLAWGQFGLTPASRPKISTTQSSQPQRVFDLRKNATEAG